MRVNKTVSRKGTKFYEGAKNALCLCVNFAPLRETTSTKSELMKRLTLAVIFVTAALTAHAQNCAQFRGAGATGGAEGTAQPVKFDAPAPLNVRWKTAIPGLSHGSPVVWGNKVFVVSAVSAGKDETRFGLFGDVAPVKDDPKHAWKVYALDKATGKILWEQTPYEGIPKVKRHPKSSHAASTPVTDGKYLIVNFGSEGL